MCPAHSSCSRVFCRVKWFVTHPPSSVSLSVCAALIAIRSHVVSFHACVTNASEAIMSSPLIRSLPLILSHYTRLLFSFIRCACVCVCATKQSQVISCQLDAMKRVTCVTLAFTLPWCIMINDIFSYIPPLHDNEHHSSHRGRGWSTHQEEGEIIFAHTNTHRVTCQVFSSLHLTRAARREEINSSIDHKSDKLTKYAHTHILLCHIVSGEAIDDSPAWASRRVNIAVLVSKLLT